MRFDLLSGAVLFPLAFATFQVALPEDLQLSDAAAPEPGASAAVPPVETPPPLAQSRAEDEPQSAGAAAVASYALSAKLDKAEHRLKCTGTIVWQNSSQAPATELWLHLYLNAFKNDKTLFLRSPFGGGRSGDRAKQYGYIDVKHLIARELDNLDLWKDAAKHSPSDPDDQTDIQVPLPNPVEPGAQLTLDIEFESKLPEIVERTGFMGDYHLVAQWFPKLARREADGRWVHFPFHAQSEFYADYGDYDVTLDVPKEMVVGATGKLVDKSIDKDRAIYRYHAESVHDFAWTAWPGFQEQSERIAGIDIRLLYPRGHEQNIERTREVLRFAIPHFNRRYGEYPYPTLTVVHPPQNAANSGGMEYPTLITTGGPWYAAWSGVRGVEAVTVHELGHQWFYGLVASNEHAFPYLDEGINSYAEGEALKAFYGAGSIVDFFGLKVQDNYGARSFAVERGHDEIVASPAAGFESFRNMGALVYSRTATILTTLERVYGKPALDKALAAYTRRFRFAHPTPSDFSNVIGEFLGAQAKMNLERALFERGFVDYLVRDLQSANERPANGIFDAADGTREVKKPNPNAALTSYVSRAVVYRHGSLEFPVEIELTAQDGSKFVRHWDGRGLTHVVQHHGSSPIVSVVVDPSSRVLLDENLFNNASSAKPSGTLRVFERALYVSELLLSTLGP